MYYIIGDIHGYLNRLIELVQVIRVHMKPEDSMIFLGDYIDRGPDSFEVIEYLLALSGKYTIIFLRGNHEDMMEIYLQGRDTAGNFIHNGGKATVQSYIKNTGEFLLPEKHRVFYKSLQIYYEGEDFIAVHAGLNPKIEDMRAQIKEDLLWIRENFYRDLKRWSKTVIFGHTPTPAITPNALVYIDDKRNIIGIDSGVIMGNPMICLRWPDRKIFYGNEK